jgi:chromosome segregation ATPase
MIDRFEEVLEQWALDRRRMATLREDLDEAKDATAILREKAANLREDLDEARDTIVDMRETIELTEYLRTVAIDELSDAKATIVDMRETVEYLKVAVDTLLEDAQEMDDEADEEAAQLKQEIKVLRADYATALRRTRSMETTAKVLMDTIENAAQIAKDVSS